MNILFELRKNRHSCYLARIDDGIFELREHQNNNEVTQYYLNDIVLKMIENCENMNSDVNFHIQNPKQIKLSSIDELKSFLNEKL